jgi:hypothetical protein
VTTERCRREPSQDTACERVRARKSACSSRLRDVDLVDERCIGGLEELPMDGGGIQHREATEAVVRVVKEGGVVSATATRVT